MSIAEGSGSATSAALSTSSLTNRAGGSGSAPFGFAQGKSLINRR
ncbi:hypothetical protein [Nostoc sp. FACHB-280]|nr:hypothetical protein [Nostoc sp. FACHB-280]